MRVRDHILISTVCAALAAPFIGRGAVSLWAGGVFIDADHYVWFCLRQRRLSLPAAVHFFNEAGPPQHPATRALHAPVALVVAFLLALRQRQLLPIAVGMGLHAALDKHHLARMDRARSAALARDGHSCQVCGTTTMPIGAHVWSQPRLLPSYRSQNLISLCTRCHETAHARSREPARWT